MYEEFTKTFRRDADETGTLRAGVIGLEPLLGELFAKFAGASFERGLYRIMKPEAIQGWNDLIVTAFPGFRNRLTPFAYDWLGRMFALDAGRLEAGHAGVVMFEPGTGEALEVPANVESFHEQELIHYRDAALAAGFHADWLAGGGAPPKPNQCIGYKKPLFLGGVDTVENLEVSDLDVYWTVTAQLIRSAKGLPAGTPLKFTIED